MILKHNGNPMNDYAYIYFLLGWIKFSTKFGEKFHVKNNFQNWKNVILQFIVRPQKSVILQFIVRPYDLPPQDFEQPEASARSARVTQNRTSQTSQDQTKSNNSKNSNNTKNIHTNARMTMKRAIQKVVVLNLLHNFT